MDRFDRIFELHRLLSQARAPVPHSRIEAQLECSRSTATRVIQSMRNYLNAPIVYDREHDGYHYDRSAPEGSMYELPGLWFNASELHALLTMRELLQRVQPGLFEEQLSPIARQLDRLLRLQGDGGDDVGHRVRILGMAHRAPGTHFDKVAGATVQRRRLDIRYHNRGSDGTDDRQVSPQRLVHYRDNWYLDAWCHRRDGLRTFSLEQMRHVQALDTPAVDIPDVELDTHYATAYGIFAGPVTDVAVLRFSPRRARWVAQEQWHPEQRGQYLDDGRFELRIPYGDPTELVMDILRHGPEVEVVAPVVLRQVVTEQLRCTLAQYR
jgi:proteasome accessory factor C